MRPDTIQINVIDRETQQDLRILQADHVPDVGDFLSLLPMQDSEKLVICKVVERLFLYMGELPLFVVLNTEPATLEGSLGDLHELRFGRQS